jgi:hypothetical protein
MRGGHPASAPSARFARNADEAVVVEPHALDDELEQRIATQRVFTNATC